MKSTQYPDMILSCENIAKLQSDIDYQFKNIILLTEALTHASIKQTHPNALSQHQRFEFLGDAILGFVITKILFEQFPTAKEGKLAQMKSYLVSKVILSKIANHLDLGSYIIMSPGEEKLQGRNNVNTLEDTLESLIAAIYLDSNLTQIETVIQSLWKNHLETTTLEDLYIEKTSIDPKTALQELAHKEYNTLPEYQLIHQVGQPHSSIFTVQVKVGDKIQIAKGKSIKIAEKTCAKQFLDKYHLR